MDREDYNTPEYNAWRRSVMFICHWQCQMCDAKSTDQMPLEAHHIKPYAKYPKLKHMVNNGIALCRNCHEYVTGKEEQYENLFKKTMAKRLEEYKRSLTQGKIKHRKKEGKLFKGRNKLNPRIKY